MSNKNSNGLAEIQAASLAAINNYTRALSVSEKITRTELAGCATELLRYYSEHLSTDIGAVNRLLAVLTPFNRRMAVLFFANFLPWKYDDDKGIFTTMKGNKQRDKCFTACHDFLRSGKTIWDWSANIQTEIKPADWSGRLSGTVSKAISETIMVKGEEVENTTRMTPSEVIKAVLAGGVRIMDILAAMNEMEEHAKAADLRNESEAGPIVSDEAPTEEAPVETVKRKRSRKAA
jgi:hypothetical protein